VTGLQSEAEAVNERAAYGRLTTFELLTTLAFIYFAQKGAQFQVLEVGMGGQFDATNVITPEVCVIASISLDHTEVLGDSLVKIAREKAGIIKPGCRVVTSPQSDDVDRVIQSVCAGHGAGLVRVGRDVTVEESRFDMGRQRFRVQGRLDTYELSIPLLGRHQLDNAAVAVAALEVLAERGFAITGDSIGRGLSQVDWPGRLQVVSQRPLIVVDGAHNPDSARRLKESLGQYFEFDRAILIIGTSDDKDIAGVVSHLAPVFDNVIVARSQHPRALPAAAISAEFGRYGIEAQVAEDIPSAMDKAVALAGDRDIICVAGSLFVVAEAIERAKKLYPQANT
jgi:dihydrofolate synthase/folylpolyglutamate synthase